MSRSFAGSGALADNTGMDVSSKVPAGFKNALLVDYLAARFSYFPAQTWAGLVENGRLSHNNRPCTLETRVRQGDLVTYHMPDPAPPENMDAPILYEDDWLLGVAKPAGLRMHSQGKFVTENLIYYLRYQHEPPYLEADLVNRLDTYTSGVVVLAKDKETLRQLSASFAAGQVEKTYLAVVDGQPEPAGGVIDLPLGGVAGTKTARQQVLRDGGGKTAVTHYHTLETLGPSHALLQLRPQTGRTHQLRVHLAAIGHPIVGDALYQMSDEDYLHWVQNGRSSSQMPLLQRQALHCAATQFIHPVTGKQCALEAPLPADMVDLIAVLKREA
ncbi:MAG: RluA family pseudouridine synthase [Chloroflexota bacterium]